MSLSSSEGFKSFVVIYIYIERERETEGDD